MWPTSLIASAGADATKWSENRQKAEILTSFNLVKATSTLSFQLHTYIYSWCAAVGILLWNIFNKFMCREVECTRRRILNEIVICFLCLSAKCRSKDYWPWDGRMLVRYRIYWILYNKIIWLLTDLSEICSLWRWCTTVLRFKLNFCNILRSCQNAQYIVVQ